jgi:serine/threonine-protein kinase RsbW
MARRLHVQKPECALRKEATMFEEIKAECRLAEDMPQGRAASFDSQSLRPASFVELRNILPSHIAVVSPLVDQLMRFISRFRVTDENNVEIELTLREALVNAIVHGNQKDPRKRVYLNCRCTTDGEVSITVEDEGNGFDHDGIPDPTSPDNRLRTHGRGIYLIRTLMDEVHFEQGGSVVHMRKRANAGSDTARKPQ